MSSLARRECPCSTKPPSTVLHAKAEFCTASSVLLSQCVQRCTLLYCCIIILDSVVMLTYRLSPGISWDVGS